MRGFAPWPALITQLDGNSVSVEFFGDHTTHKSTLANIYDFKGCRQSISANLSRLKNPLFAKAVHEAEIALGIPEYLKITK